MRRIAYRNAETRQRSLFLTINVKLAASTIAACYKECWQIELFFKWIKQNLKIKDFLRTGKNAVMTQIRIALCVYLMLADLKYQLKISGSMRHMIRLLQFNLFARRDLLCCTVVLPSLNHQTFKPKWPSHEVYGTAVGLIIL